MTFARTGLLLLALWWQASAQSGNGTALHAAATRGDITEAQRLLEQRSDVNAKNSAGDRPLHIASRSGHIEFVRLLLNRGAKVDSENDQQDTALSIAASSGNVGLVRLLVESGAKISSTVKTPLAEAFLNGHYNLAGLLIGARSIDASPDLAEKRRPVYVAVLSEDDRVVKTIDAILAVKGYKTVPFGPYNEYKEALARVKSIQTKLEGMLARGETKLTPEIASETTNAVAKWQMHFKTVYAWGWCGGPDKRKREECADSVTGFLNREKGSPAPESRFPELALVIVSGEPTKEATEVMVRGGHFPSKPTGRQVTVETGSVASFGLIDLRQRKVVLNRVTTAARETSRVRTVTDGLWQTVYYKFDDRVETVRIRAMTSLLAWGLPSFDHLARDLSGR